MKIAQIILGIAVVVLGVGGVITIHEIINLRQNVNELRDAFLSVSVNTVGALERQVKINEAIDKELAKRKAATKDEKELTGLEIDIDDAPPNITLNQKADTIKDSVGIEIRGK